MKTSNSVLMAIAAAALLLLGVNQWRLFQQLEALRAEQTALATAQAAIAAEKSAASPTDDTAQRLAAALALAEFRLNSLTGRLAQAETRSVESTRRIARLPRGDVITLADPTPATTATNPPGRRAWGAEQAEGEPDTMQAGDLQTAWAPREPDGGEEWLKVDFDREVEIAQVRVRETYNPGAISRISAVNDNGTEVPMWEGVEPASAAPVEMEFTFQASVRARSVKVYLDTRRVAGWNEIDAVQIVGRDGSRQWAKRATASSSYADRMGGPFSGFSPGRVSGRETGLEILR